MSRRQSVFATSDLVGSSVRIIDTLGGDPERPVLLASLKGAGSSSTLIAAQIVADELLAPGRDADLLRRDIRMAASLHCQGLVPTLGTQAIDGHTVMMTPLVGGVDLGLLLSRTRLDERVACYIAHRVAIAIDSISRATDLLGEPLGLNHGSITPDKILLSFSGDVFLLPYSFPAAGVRARSPMTRWPCELYPWLPPEVAQKEPMSLSADLYMLGVTLYTMLTGSPPFPSGVSMGPANVCLVPSTATVRPDLRPSLSHLVQQLMKLEPHARPNRVGDLRGVLEVRGGRGQLAALLQDTCADRRSWLERTIARIEISRPTPVPLDPLEEFALPSGTRPAARRSQALAGDVSRTERQSIQDNPDHTIVDATQPPNSGDTWVIPVPDAPGPPPPTKLFDESETGADDDNRLSAETFMDDDALSRVIAAPPESQVAAPLAELGADTGDLLAALHSPAGSTRRATSSAEAAELSDVPASAQPISEAPSMAVPADPSTPPAAVGSAPYAESSGPPAIHLGELGPVPFSGVAQAAPLVISVPDLASNQRAEPIRTRLLIALVLIIAALAVWWVPLPQPPSQLIVIGAPAGASVQFSGVDVPLGGLIVDPGAERGALHIAADGYQEYSRTLEVGQGERRVIRVHLQPE